MARPAVLLQPIVDLADGRAVAQEALCRVPGSPFRYLCAGGAASLPMPIALALEARMLDAALRARPRVPRGQALALNLSPSALLDPEIRRLLAEAGPLRGVIVELTEHRAPAPHDPVAAAVAALRAAGATIVLDDAGGGRGALRCVRSLMPDLIKLDGNAVSRVDRDPIKRMLVESVLAVAREVDIPVIAEGIETTHELDALLRMGIRLGQGYFLARPAEEPGVVSPHVRRWLQARAGRLAARTAVARGPRVATAS